jgi:hypothetical protein
MPTSAEEKVLKSLWHMLIASVGVYELFTNHTKASKVLSVGLIAFHIEAAICDALDRPTTLQRMLRRLR